MKKIFYILIFLFTIPQISLSQNDTIIPNENSVFKNQFNLNIEFAGIGFGYKKRVKNNWFIGGNVNLGVIALWTHHNDDDESKVKLEFFHASFLVNYYVNDFLSIESGPKFSSLLDSESSTFERFEWEIGVYAGLKKIQIGFRVGLFGIENHNRGFENQNEKYSNSFLIIRIPLTKW